MRLSTGRLALLLGVGVILDVAPLHAQLKSAPPQLRPANAITRRFVANTGPAVSSGVKSLQLEPDAVYAGQLAMLTVELPAPAPAGGTTVLLTLSPGGVATVESPLTVAAGQTTRSTMVQTTAGRGGATLDILASTAGSTGKLSAALQVVAAPPPISAFTGFPAVARAGNPVTGTLTVASPAPAGGAVVPLYATVTGNAVVPASVTIPAGQTSAPVTIATGQAAGKVTLFASASDRLRGCPAAAPCASIQVVTPPEIASVAVVGNSTTVEGGATVAANVTLSQPSPTPVTVTLASSDAQVASPKTTVIWTNPDNTTVQLQAVTHAVSAPATVTLTATCVGCQGTTSKAVTLQVVPALEVSAIAASPAQLKGGAPGTVTVTLNKTYSARVTVVLMSSNPTICSVPREVYVPAGQTGATATISTSAVAAPATVTLSAALMGRTAKTTTLSVVP